MEHSVLLRHRVKVYGDSFQVELRKHTNRDGGSWFHLVDIYEHCEHDRGIPYHTLDDAIRGFKAACGVTVSDELKAYLGKR